MGLLADDIYGYGSTLGEIDKPVVDHTGLQGRFDYSLDLPARMISLIPKPPNPDDPPKGMLLPNAVREQLERSTGRVRRLIVDHVERHSDN
jgi:uncharacterized protein (TIGR03435 family)